MGTGGDLNTPREYQRVTVRVGVRVKEFKGVMTWQKDVMYE